MGTEVVALEPGGDAWDTAALTAYVEGSMTGASAAWRS